MVMSTDIERETISLEKDADGVLRVSGTRVTLDTLVAAFQDGATPEEIAQQYPSIPLADIYAVIGYYLNHRSSYASERIEGGLAMPGVFEIARSIPVGRVIEDLAIIAELSLDRDWENQVR